MWRLRLLLPILLSVVACDDQPGTTLRVHAAASTTEALTEIARDFTDQTDVPVELVFGSSSDLALQILEGAPADMFVSADETNMTRIAEELAGPPSIIATNELVIAVEPGNPEGIADLDDLAGDLIIALCDPSVPCGNYSEEVLDSAGVEPRADSLESDVKAVVTRVALGEADAGLVYSSDVTAAAGDIERVLIPPQYNVVARYPAGVIEGSHEAEALRFVEYLEGSKGQEILRAYGFSAP